MNADIFLVDDDKDLAELLQQYFADFNLSLDYENLPNIALQKIEKEHYSVLILDLMMPKIDGFEFLRRLNELRNNGVTHIKDLAIIVLSARVQVADKISALELGAEDYLTKPFEPRELLLRVKNLIQRFNLKRSKQQKQYGNNEALQLNKAERKIVFNNQKLTLTHNEFQFLYLLTTENRPFSKYEIFNYIHGSDILLDSRSIDVLVSRLRKKLSNHFNKNFILTLHGKGFQIAF